MDEKIKQIKDNGIESLILVGGVTAALAAVGFAKGKVSPLVETAIALVPGFALAIGSKNQNLKSFGKGWIATGIINGANQLTAGKTGILKTVNDALPKLSGISGLGSLAAVNTDFAYQQLGQAATAEVPAVMSAAQLLYP